MDFHLFLITIKVFMTWKQSFISDSQTTTNVVDSLDELPVDKTESIEPFVRLVQCICNWIEDPFLNFFGGR